MPSTRVQGRKLSFGKLGAFFVVAHVLWWKGIRFFLFPVFPSHDQVISCEVLFQLQRPIVLEGAKEKRNKTPQRRSFLTHNEAMILSRHEANGAPCSAQYLTNERVMWSGAALCSMRYF